MKNKITCMSLHVHTYTELDDPPEPSLVAWVHREGILPNHYEIHSPEVLELAIMAIKKLAVKP